MTGDWKARLEVIEADRDVPERAGVVLEVVPAQVQRSAAREDLNERPCRTLAMVAVYGHDRLRTLLLALFLLWTAACRREPGRSQKISAPCACCQAGN
jgi:hypothetical protein